MPWHDWQFWVVTLVTLGAAASLVWQWVRPLFVPSASPCGSCASGAAACAKPRPSEAPLVTLGSGRVSRS